MRKNVGLLSGILWLMFGGLSLFPTVPFLLWGILALAAWYFLLLALLDISFGTVLAGLATIVVVGYASLTLWIWSLVIFAKPVSLVDKIGTLGFFSLIFVPAMFIVMWIARYLELRLFRQVQDTDEYRKNGSIYKKLGNL